jgi:hypothetical protein
LKLWQMYVWAFSGILVFSAIGRGWLFVKKRELVTRLDLLEGAAGLAVIPALFGFAYQRAYGSRVLWAVMCVVLVVLSVYQFFTPKMRKIYDKGLPTAVGVIALQAVLGGPGLWAIICYAFFDRRVWGY